MRTGGHLTRDRGDVEELRRRNAELETRLAHSTQVLRQLEAGTQRAAGAAHDIRNALMVILSEADGLTRTLHDPDQLESAKAMSAAALIIAELARELVGSAQKIRGRVSEVQTSQHMLTCQQLIVKMMDPSVVCAFAFDAELWPVTVQQQKLEAALLNLAANARDATALGGCVRISARNLQPGTPLPLGLAPGDYVCFRVEDEGAGMSREVLARATEPFFTTKGRERGTGLGLAMVKAFATEAGGTLQIRSEQGGGTIVEILLPRAAARPKPLDATDRRHASLQRLRARLRDSRLSEALSAWCDACASGLPTPARLEMALLEHAAHVVVIAVDAACKPATLRLVRMGDDIVRALERLLLGDIAMNGRELFGSVEVAYLSVLRSRRPSYQYLRYSFGADPPAQFERLILPAAVDGHTVSHLFGVILMSGNITEPETRDNPHEA
jgi:nitrogen-specific signal transduction histidine kinase